MTTLKNYLNFTLAIGVLDQAKILGTIKTIMIMTFYIDIFI